MWAISTLKRNLSTCPKNCGILSHSWPIWSKRSWFYIWNIFYQNYLDIDTLTSCQGCQNSLLTILRQLNFSEHVFKHNTGHSHLLLQSLCGSLATKPRPLSGGNQALQDWLLPASVGPFPSHPTGPTVLPKFFRLWPTSLCAMSIVLEHLTASSFFVCLIPL